MAQMDKDSILSETVLADGMFSYNHGVSGKEFYFITITSHRAICTSLGKPGGAWLGVFGIIGLAIGSIFSMPPIRESARQLSSSSVSTRLSLFPDTTSVYPLADVSLEKSVWTGTKIVIGTNKYVLEDGTLPAFEAAIKSNNA